MPTRARIAMLLAAAALAAAAGWSRWRAAQPSPGVASASVVDFLSARTGQAGFARATGPRSIRFPADEGPHPEYQTEWWYYTGNLAAAPRAGGGTAGSSRSGGDGNAGSSISGGDGASGSSGTGGDLTRSAGSAGDARRFGFQLTFFRRALAPAPALPTTPRASAWATDQLYLAHFAVTDVAAGAFHSAERLARGAAGLAGARGAPYRVWVEGWSAERAEFGGIARGAGGAGGLKDGDGASGAGSTNDGDRTAGAASDPVRLVAADGPVAIDLLLRPAKPPALHGNRGYSVKGPAPGNASYYFSYPRLAATGTVTTAAGTFDVSGAAWMDHEWSTSALSASQVGWDWFALQLDDGRELMLFQLRERGGGVSAESSGSLVEKDGSVVPLAREDFTLVGRGTWTSPRTGGAYPAGWRVAVPRAGLDLAVEPLADDQELDVGFKYWEGAVKIGGTADGRPIAGYGYVELTGYAEARRSPVE